MHCVQEYHQIETKSDALGVKGLVLRRARTRFLFVEIDHVGRLHEEVKFDRPIEERLELEEARVFRPESLYGPRRFPTCSLLSLQFASFQVDFISRLHLTS